MEGDSGREAGAEKSIFFFPHGHPLTFARFRQNRGSVDRLAGNNAPINVNPVGGGGGGGECGQGAGIWCLRLSPLSGF